MVNRTARLYALVEELRAAAPRSLTVAALAARLEVSTRTVQRDLQALMEAGVPVRTTTGRGGGWSIDPAMTLPPIHFTPDEAAVLAAALAGADGSTAARTAFQRLKETVIALADMDEPLPLPAPKHVLQVERITVAAPDSGRVLLSDVEFQVRAGQALGIIGPSGGGKTTLVRALTGIWPVLRGSVRLDGAELTQWQDEDIGRHIGLTLETEGGGRSNAAYRPRFARLHALARGLGGAIPHGALRERLKSAYVRANAVPDEGQTAPEDRDALEEGIESAEEELADDRRDEQPGEIDAKHGDDNAEPRIAKPDRGERGAGEVFDVDDDPDGERDRDRGEGSGEKGRAQVSVDRHATASITAGGRGRSRDR